MESPSTKSAQKILKNGNSQSATTFATKGMVRYSPPQQAIKNLSMSKDEMKERQSDKYKVSQKPPAKENTKPQEIKLHTQQRAVKRAIFNYSVATKIYLNEQQKKQIEKVQKIIEEEEVRMLRKEMIPRAQLMPLFDRPFFPQRSNRPLTVPREPSFHIMGSKCLSCIYCGDLYHFQHNEAH